MLQKFVQLLFENGGMATDLSFVDLFTGLYSKNLFWENELYFHLEKQGSKC